MSEPSIGQTLATRFTLIRLLGKGGMGAVWLARDDELRTEVALKILASDASAERIALLRQECRSTRRLSHPNIVSVYDVHRDAERAFISVEYVEGGDIGELRGASVGRILAAVLLLVDALDYAHRAGVVHRDLKCSNVLLDPSGRPRLTDFGIAGLLEPRTPDLLLCGGGSRHAISPQQLAGEPPSPADDIYGLGALLYELLSGCPPFEGNVTDEEIVTSMPPPLVSSHPLPDGLAPLVHRMLAKSPDDRPRDMATVRTELTRLLGSTSAEAKRSPGAARRQARLSPPPRVSAVRRSRAEDSRPPGRSRRLWIAASICALLASAALAVFIALPRWVRGRESALLARRPDAAPATPAVAGQQGVTEPSSRITSPDPPTEVRVEPTERSARRSRPALPPVGKPTTGGNPLPAADPVEQSFAQAMSEGLAALERSEFEEARQAFERAASLSPGAAEAAEGLARADQELRLSEISDHRERALAFEQEERWHDAAAEYMAVLGLDAAIRFAQQGRRRALARADLSDRLEFQIARPDRLASDDVLEEASALLSEARSSDPKGRVLLEQIERLERQVELAATPVRVVLISDNLTEVSVYRLGRLGRFARRSLDLRPGRYTVIGTRSGYRDVRRQLEVQPGRIPQPLVVRCEERI